ncbi:MAG: hypothetical protein R3C19_07080 [Planctomycetaceae bacterium]
MPPVAPLLPLIALDDFIDDDAADVSVHEVPVHDVPERDIRNEKIGFRSEPAPDTLRVEHPSHENLAAPKFERYRDESGSELVEGTMLVRFERGQKKVNLHVPFSPPLAGTPEVECESVGDLPLRLKVPVRQSYGLRIEARRSNTDEPAETEIGFAAIYSPNSSASR